MEVEKIQLPAAAIEDNVVEHAVLVEDTLAAEKKDLWMGGMINCFSSVFSFFNREDLKLPGDDWETPFAEITELTYIGAGAQGFVFRGNFKGEMVAVKKLQDKSETDLKHLRQLDHENIVRFKGIVCEPPVYCVIMEFCQYGPLFDFLHSGVGCTSKQILKWATQISQGMAYLHSHKIIHRDLKSPNILITDNLIVKVSDFGTSREWHFISDFMSFTGTVAWMAPEIIRHEPCSDRVDVWSFGVVLWELLTQEAPYKNMEVHAIMWGVGTNSLSLPIPPSCPNSLSLLMKQCWNRVSRNRPCFKTIISHLEQATEELSTVHPVHFGSSKEEWRKEVKDSIEEMKVTPMPNNIEGVKCIEPRHPRDLRTIYEEQMTRANDLYMEVCTVRLQLEQREKVLAQREKALKSCRCLMGFRKSAYLHQTSSSSESQKPGHIVLSNNFAEFNRRRKKRMMENAAMQPSQVLVNFVDKGLAEQSKYVTTAVKEKELSDGQMTAENVSNNNSIAAAPVTKIDTVIEYNGNVDDDDFDLDATGNDGYPKTDDYNKNDV